MASYQDYVIKDGVFVGKFEEMYQEFPDPWNIKSQGRHNPVEALAINAAQRYYDEQSAKRVLDIGCGLGDFTARLSAIGLEVTGSDCSPTAVAKASQGFPHCRFVCADALDRDLIRQVRPDLVVLSEVMWYILPKLDELLSFLSQELPNVKLINLLTFYPQGRQRYGVEWFTNLQELLSYLEDRGLLVEEYSQVFSQRFNGTTKTYLCGQWR